MVVISDTMAQNQLLKFLAVGISNTIISYIVFLVCYNALLAGGAFTSQTISYASGIVWSFFWNKRWTFVAANRSWSAFFPFLAVQILLLLLSSSALMMVSQTTDWNLNYVWILVMAIVTAINFIVSKKFVFRG
jgi:putative flippase GtrA